MTVNYYKATRPDGTDFYTGTINYAHALETGEAITHPGEPIQNNPATYLSVSIAPADCTGMRWPCRLFRVEPIGELLTTTYLSNKRACKTLRVVEELPAWQALGPNGEAVVRHIERCKVLTSEQVVALDAAWGAAWGAARYTAWGAARYTARNAARNAVWDAARNAARNAAWDAAWTAAWDAAWGTARDAALDAVWDAALALVVRDLITPAQFDMLYGPWQSVMEENRDTTV